MKLIWGPNDLKLMPPQRFYREGLQEEYTLAYIGSGTKMVLVSCNDGNVVFALSPLSPEDMAQHLNDNNMRPVEMRDYLRRIEKVDK